MMARASFIILALATAANLRLAAGAAGSRSSGGAVRGTASNAAFLKEKQRRQLQPQQRPGSLAVDAGANAADDSPSFIVQKKGRSQENLRVCNAFAHSAPLEITHVRLATQIAKLPYKECGDYNLNLKEGDQLDFKADGNDVGTFSVAGLPRVERTLLLIVHRRVGSKDGTTAVLGSNPITGATFKSHVFAQGSPETAQVATIDAYRGSTSSKVQIADTAGTNTTKKDPEVLALNSVVTIVPGTYEVSLQQGGTNTSKLFDAQGHGNYVILRVGAQEPNQDGTFPEDLVVFPQNAAARSATAIAGLFLAALLHIMSFSG